MFTYTKSSDPQYAFQTSDNYLFHTEDEARRYCEAWNEWFDISDTLPRRPLTAEEYAAACAKFNVPSWEHDLNSYAIQYGEFDPVRDGIKTKIEMALARSRRATRIDEVKAARAAKPAPACKPSEMVMCSCGHEVERGLVMNASLGTSCPDCYDRLSN